MEASIADVVAVLEPPESVPTVDIIDVDALSSDSDGVMVLDGGDAVVTGEGAAKLMHTQPWLLPQDLIVRQRRPLPTPHRGRPLDAADVLSVFELEHHFTIAELRDYAKTHEESLDLLEGCSKMSKSALAKRLNQAFEAVASK